MYVGRAWQSVSLTPMRPKLPNMPSDVPERKSDHWALRMAVKAKREADRREEDAWCSGFVVGLFASWAVVMIVCSFLFLKGLI